MTRHQSAPEFSWLPCPTLPGLVDAGFALLFQLYLQLVDLGGQDEVILRQAVKRVRGQFDGDVSIPGEVQVGMMAFFFRKVTDAVEEVKGGREVLDPPLA